MAMVNMNNLINGKDSRWLQLEVCREFQRNKCTRPDTECKFAHPPANVEVLNGKVTACYDSIKGRCNREKPPCKYFHPPQHLKDQLLINGRNHLALKNALLQQMGLTPGQPLVAGQVPAAVATNPYLTGMPQVGNTFNPFFTPGPMMPAIVGPDPAVGSPLGVVPQTVVPQKLPRSDRLEMDMKSSVGSFYYESFAFPGMVPYKRPAADKSGVPVYQPGATYQQLMQLQQPFVPVSCEYTATTHVPSPSEGKSETEERPGIGPIPDAAARAKEVATQSYAKAKLAAAALNYTGVSLNKQTPPAAPLPRGYPYTFSAQTYQIPYAKPPPPVNPYAFLRPTYTVPPPATPSNPVLVGNHLLVGSMLSHYPTAAPTAAATTTTTTHENNNTSPQPYKKMKTT